MQGYIINSYLYCKRKAWLAYHRINLEENSEDVIIGKSLHEINKNKNSEIKIEDIKIDSMTSEYVIEIKKSDSDIEAASWQLKYYLYVLNKKGIYKKGKLKIIEKNTIKKDIIIQYNNNIENEIELLLNEIENTIKDNNIPELHSNIKKCKKCAYHDYCFL